jgi:hypothetical protein
MSDEDIEFGDIDPDDVHDEGDADIDYSQVDAVQEQVDAVNAVEDDEDRLSAAQRWSKELAGEEIT